MREKFLINQGAVTVEFHIQLENALSNNKRKKAIRKHPLIHATIIISTMNGMVRNQTCASDVDWRIISLQFVSKPETSDKKVHWNMENPKTRAYILKKIDKTSESSTYKSESQKIYAPMACMSANSEIPRRNYGDSSQLNKCILDSGETCHMNPEI